MQKYNSLNELVNDCEKLPIPGRIYVQIDNNEELINSYYWVISSKEAKSETTPETSTVKKRA